MGNFARYSPEGKTAAADIVTDCIAKCSEVNTKLTTFTTEAPKQSATWPGSYVKTSDVKYGGEHILDSQGNYKTDADGNYLYTSIYYKYKNNFESSEYKTDSAALQGGIDACKRDYVNPHNRLSTALSNAWTELNGDVTDCLNKINTMLTAIETAATTFDGLSGSLQSVIDGIEGLELGANIAIEVNEFGDEVMYYNVYDEDGNLVGKYTIAEMVNSFYTYTGSALSGAIANEMMMEKILGFNSSTEGLTAEQKKQLDDYRNNFVAGIGNNVYQLMGKGFMSVASEGNIEKMYKDIVGDDLSNITSKYKSILDGKLKLGDEEFTIGDLFNTDGTASLIAGGVAMAASSAYTLGENVHSANNVTENAARQESFKNKKKDDDEEKEDGKDQDTGAGDDDATNQNDDGKNDWSDQGSNSDGGSYGGGPTGGNGNYDDGGSSNDGGNTDDGETPTTTPPTTDNGGNTPETDNRFTDVVEAEIPSEPMEIEVTNEDIDALARDEFYDKYSIPEDLAERRQMDIDKFEELFNSENKEELVNKFIEMGYDPAEALGAANNKDVGLAAFLLGSQNQELTQIAQDFASELGLGDKFDTSYDDAPDYTDLFDGDAQVDLTSPSTNEAIMSAKADVQEAKTAYSESVTNANQYIEEATKAKGDLDSLRATIESVSGKDTSKWTEAQISQYNKAAETYNTAVTKANEEVAAASKAKELYTQAKDNLQKVEESYYNEIREAIKQQNGYDNGGINSTLSGTPGTGNLAGTPLGNNPNQTQDVSDEALIEQLFENM